MVAIIPARGCDFKVFVNHFDGKIKISEITRVN